MYECRFTLYSFQGAIRDSQLLVGNALSRFCHKWQNVLVGSNGIEPSTSRLSGVRSNHLSYEPISADVLLLKRSVLLTRVAFTPIVSVLKAMICFHKAATTVLSAVEYLYYSILMIKSNGISWTFKSRQ